MTKLILQKLYLNHYLNKNMPLIPYKNENINSLLLTLVKKTIISTRQIEIQKKIALIVTHAKLNVL